MDMFITSAGMLALVKAFVDLIKYVRARDTNGWLTQLVVWLAGIAVVLLLRESDFATTLDIGGILLSDANIGSVVLAGLGLGSAAMLTNDFKKAFDNQDDARKPDLVSGNVAPPRGP